ncbi:MAG: VOC family protein, partial [Thermaerobacterales bacterium]
GSPANRAKEAIRILFVYRVSGENVQKIKGGIVMIGTIKHMAFAVQDVSASLAAYQRFLRVDTSVEPRTLQKARSREAHFNLGGTQFQLCESLDDDGRFADHISQYGEGLHHICLTVDDIEAALQHVQAQGAALQQCRSCKVTGSHDHPEGLVAFVADGTVPGLSVEFMQVWTEAELAARSGRAVADV